MKNSGCNKIKIEGGGDNIFFVGGGHVLVIAHRTKSTMLAYLNLV